MRDLVVVRVRHHDLVDGLVRVSRPPRVRVEARSQVLGHVSGAGDVAGQARRGGERAPAQEVQDAERDRPRDPQGMLVIDFFRQGMR